LNTGKSNLAQKQFLEDLNAKASCPLNSIENIWLKRFVFQQCGHVMFSSKL
jgi:hypothetical protein